MDDILYIIEGINLTNPVYYHIILLMVSSTLDWPDKYMFYYNLNTSGVLEEENNGLFLPLGNRDGALFKPVSNIENVNCLLTELGEQNTKKISFQQKEATKNSILCISLQSTQNLPVCMNLPLP